MKKNRWLNHKCNNGKFSCDQCSYSTGRSDTLNRHKKAKHSGVINNNSVNNNSLNNNTVNNNSVNNNSVNNNSVNNNSVNNNSIGINSENKAPALATVTKSNNNIAPDNPNSKVVRTSVKEKGPSPVSFPSAVKAGVTGMLTMALLSGCAVLPPESLTSASEDKAGDNDDDNGNDDEWEWLDAIQPSERRGRGRPPGRTPHICGICNFAAPTYRRLLGHLRKHDRAAKHHYCEHKCGHSSLKPSDIKKHEATCLRRPQKVNQLDADTIWEILSLCPLSNNIAFKLLKLLEKALGVKYLPPYFKKSLSDYLNSTYQFLESEIVTFKVRIFNRLAVFRDKPSGHCSTRSSSF